MTNRHLIACALGAALWLGALSAEARTTRELTYTTHQVWTAAVRFVRVDLGATILEKDRGTGYLLFEYRDAGRTSPASLELIPVEANGKRWLKARLSIERLPTYVEGVIFDRLVRRLQEDYGDPPAAVLLPVEEKKPAGKKKAPGATGPAATDDEGEPVEPTEDDLEEQADRDEVPE